MSVNSSGFDGFLGQKFGPQCGLGPSIGGGEVGVSGSSSKDKKKDVTKQPNDVPEKSRFQSVLKYR